MLDHTGNINQKKKNEWSNFNYTEMNKIIHLKRGKSFTVSTQHKRIAPIISEKYDSLYDLTYQRIEPMPSQTLNQQDYHYTTEAVQ